MRCVSGGFQHTGGWQREPRHTTHEMIARSSQRRECHTSPSQTSALSGGCLSRVQGTGCLSRVCRHTTHATAFAQDTRRCRPAAAASPPPFFLGGRCSCAHSPHLPARVSLHTYARVSSFLRACLFTPVRVSLHACARVSCCWPQWPPACRLYPVPCTPRADGLRGNPSCRLYPVPCTLYPACM